MPTIDPENSIHEWDQVPSASLGHPCIRAAKWVWLIGGIETVIFGLCSFFTAVTSQIPLEELNEMASEEQFRQLIEIYPLLGPMAVGALILGFIPGVIYLFAGFGVRSGHRTATVVALALGITQSLVLGLLFLNNVLGSIMAYDPVGLTIQVLTVGSLLLIVGYGTYQVWLAKEYSQSQLEEHVDPWNNP